MKRVTAFLLGLLLVCGSAFGQLALTGGGKALASAVGGGGPAIGVHAKVTGNGVTSRTTPSRNSVSSGSTFVVQVTDSNLDITVSDSKGNTYTRVGSVSGNSQDIYISQNGTGGTSHTLTVTWNTGTADPVVIFVEVTGVLAASYDLASMTQVANTTSPYVGTTNTLAQANSIVLFLAANGDDGSNDYTPSNGFTLIEQEADAALFWTGGVSYKVVSSTTAVSASLPGITVGTPTVRRTLFALKGS